ncbi:MAG: penicillin acylase family protein [Alphaproteobacteria bacterium]|nr:penicillin acylase family protein [Alphaproteobacteria bacterium]
MRRILRVSLLGLLTVILLLLLTALALWQRQGFDDDDWADIEAAPGATVVMDPWGVPTITAPDWVTAVEAQGYVIASERMFQMDLSRRAAAGRLAEWFGEAAVPLDRARRLEDREALAERIAAGWSEADRAVCEAHARGVNRFIADRPWGWGLEYLLLQVEPEPWRCADSALVLLAMTDTLSTSIDIEAREIPWRAALPDDWEAFLIPQEHPWNKPLLGEPAPPPPLPTPLGGGPPADVAPDTPEAGSNAWAWRGGDRAVVASDPHVGNAVPSTWYLSRLYIGPDRWAVGATLPGIGGVILGRSPWLGWGITNAREDGDDLVIEQVRDGPDGLEVLEGERWVPVEVRRAQVLVRDADPVEITATFTARGPLSRDPDTGVWTSRQWLPWAVDDIGLSHVALADARSWAEVDAVLDRMVIPILSIVMANADGGIGYRHTGRAPLRQVTGLWPHPAPEGVWGGVAPSSERPRLYLEPGEGPDRIVSANQRMWVGAWGDHWADDQRARVIDDALASGRVVSQEDHARLQMNTTNLYLQTVLRWVLANASGADPAEQVLLARWGGWDGDARTDPQTYSDALRVERLLKEQLIGAVARAYPPGEDAKPWSGRMDSAWILRALDEPGALAVFGFEPGPLAGGLLAAVAADPPPLYTDDNAWGAQHPFVGRVPYADRVFGVTAWPQDGHGGLVCTETPRHGSSVRMVWDMKDGAEATWVQPVGQSGHPRSPHYADLQQPFHEDQRVPVFPPGVDWGL